MLYTIITLLFTAYDPLPALKLTTDQFLHGRYSFHAVSSRHIHLFASFFRVVISHLQFETCLAIFVAASAIICTVCNGKTAL